MILRVLLTWLLLSAVASAATTYIDPTCTHNGDGTTETCAASAAAVGAKNAWPTASGAGDSFLQKAGTAYLARVVVGSGSAGSPVTLGAYGTGAKPIIRSEEVATQGSIQINTDAHDITIDGLEVHGQLNLSANTQSNAIRNNAASAATVVNITVQNCTIGPVVSFGGSDDDDGIDLRGQGLVILDNTFVNIANDALWLESNGAASDVIVRGNTCSRVSQVGTNGDCYQVTGTSTGVLIEDNYCDHSDVDSKQCIVVNNDATIRYNENIGPASATVHTAIYCDVGPCWIYGNKTLYGKVGIANYGTTGGATYGNLVRYPSTYGIEVNAASSPAVHNTVISSSAYAAIRMTASATSSYARNNLVQAPTEGIRLTSGSSHLESYNLFDGTIATPVYNTTTSGSLTPTNPVTASGQLTPDNKLILGSTGRRAAKVGPYCIDVRGRACPSDAPNIGAYQSTSGDPAAPRTARQ